MAPGARSAGRGSRLIRVAIADGPGRAV